MNNNMMLYKCNCGAESRIFFNTEFHKITENFFYEIDFACLFCVHKKYKDDMNFHAHYRSLANEMHSELIREERDKYKKLAEHMSASYIQSTVPVKPDVIKELDELKKRCQFLGDENEQLKTNYHDQINRYCDLDEERRANIRELGHCKMENEHLKHHLERVYSALSKLLEEREQLLNNERERLLYHQGLQENYDQLKRKIRELLKY